MAVYEFTLSGDQIATYSSLSGNGNGVDRVVTVNDVEAIGDANDIFTIRISQANDSSTEVSNGQLMTILDSSGNVVMSTTSVQPDIEQGLGAGDDHLIIQGGHFIIDLNGFDGGSQTLQIGYVDEAADITTGDNDGEFDFDDIHTAVPCFGKGTFITTPNGPRRVEHLSDGDPVTTLDHGNQTILSIWSTPITLDASNAKHRPIQIPAHAIAPNIPIENLILSPQHRIALTAQNSTQHLAPAKGLIHQRGIRVMNGKSRIDYYSILFANHQIIQANNCPCESFYPGDFIMAALPPRTSSKIAVALSTLALWRGSRLRPNCARNPHRTTNAQPQLVAKTAQRRTPVQARVNTSHLYRCALSDQVAFNHQRGIAPLTTTTNNFRPNVAPLTTAFAGNAQFGQARTSLRSSMISPDHQTRDRIDPTREAHQQRRSHRAAKPVPNPFDFPKISPPEAPQHAKAWRNQSHHSATIQCKHASIINHLISKQHSR